VLLAAKAGNFWCVVVTVSGRAFLVLGIRRNAEEEADVLGLEYAYRAGYQPGAIATYHERLRDADAPWLNNTGTATFTAHPDTTSRIENAERNIAQFYPESDSLILSTPEFDRVRARMVAASDIQP